MSDCCGPYPGVGEEPKGLQVPTSVPTTSRRSSSTPISRATVRRLPMRRHRRWLRNVGQWADRAGNGRQMGWLQPPAVPQSA